MELRVIHISSKFSKQD